jgi:hypothetical protein
VKADWGKRNEYGALGDVHNRYVNHKSVRWETMSLLKKFVVSMLILMAIFPAFGVARDNNLRDVPLTVVVSTGSSQSYVSSAHTQIHSPCVGNRQVKYMRYGKTIGVIGGSEYHLTGHRWLLTCTYQARLVKNGLEVLLSGDRNILNGS